MSQSEEEGREEEKTRVKQEERSWKMLIKKLQSTLTVL